MSQLMWWLSGRLETVPSLSCLSNMLFLLSIAWTTICLSINLLKDISVTSKFGSYE